MAAEVKPNAVLCAFDSANPVLGSILMKTAFVVAFSALLAGAAAFAQAPSSEIDAHIAAAKAAAGQDYRGTFVNLCLPAAPRGGGAGAGAANPGRGAAAGARGAGGAARGAGRGGGAPQSPDRSTWYA